MQTYYYDINELAEIVGTLNEEIAEQMEQLNSVLTLQVVLIIDGTDASVRFLDIILWYSDDEERNFNEETDSYEPMGPYLRKRLNEEITKISKLKF